MLIINKIENPFQVEYFFESTFFEYGYIHFQLNNNVSFYVFLGNLKVKVFEISIWVALKS